MVSGVRKIALTGLMVSIVGIFGVRTYDIVSYKVKSIFDRPGEYESLPRDLMPKFIEPDFNSNFQLHNLPHGFYFDNREDDEALRI